MQIQHRRNHPIGGDHKAAVQKASSSRVEHRPAVALPGGAHRAAGEVVPDTSPMMHVEHRSGASSGKTEHLAVVPQEAANVHHLPAKLPVAENVDEAAEKKSKARAKKSAAAEGDGGAQAATPKAKAKRKKKA